MESLISIIGITTGVTCAYTTVLVVKMKASIFTKLCKQIEELLIRVGVLEKMEGK